MPATIHDSETVLSLCHEEAMKGTAASVIRTGDVGKVMAAGARTLDLVYETPFAAHAAMEPQNVVVEITAEGCELWIGNQFPEDVKKEAAAFLGLDPAQVQVHVAFMGGGFGRKSQTDVAMEALALAKEIQKPIKLIWTREDDMRQSAMRPPTVNRLRGALDAMGKLQALEHTVAAPSLAYGIWGMHSPDRIPGFLVEPMGEHLYQVPNFQANFALVDVDPVPITWWRSVYASTNAFGHECFIDEMAALAGKDPFDFRMEMMTHNPRFMRLMDKLRSFSGWDQPLAAGKARGVAVVKSFESTVGHVVEVSRRENGEAQVDKVYSVVDCGLAIHPDTVKAQVEGSIVMGLSAAIKPGLTVKNNSVVESNFHDYPVLRIHETPPMEIHIMESEDDPTGIGEPALPPLAPALANALYGLSGQRIRKLPIDMAAV
jgi:isoquinoline 1-oxidoreductase beta subunit